MKTVKYRLMDAFLYDYPYIERFLAEQAAGGWHLEKAGNALWKFRRGEPKQVRYEVTYSSAASAYNSRPTEAEDALAELCAQAGWVRVTTAAQLQVFRNEDPGATPLETEENERLKNIRKTMNRHFFPQYLLMVFLFLLQFAMHTRNLLRWPSRTLADPLVVSTIGMLPVVSLTHLLLCISTLLWLRRAQKAVDEGLPIPLNRFYRWFRWVIWAGLIAYLWSLFAMADPIFASAIVLICAVVIFCVFASTSLCKHLNAPKWVNFLVPIAVTSLVMVLLLSAFITNMDRISLGQEPSHPQTLPITLANLDDPSDSEYTMFEESATPLVAYRRFSDESADARISCTIVDVKYPMFYDMIQAEQEERFLMSVRYQTDSEAAGYAQLLDAEYVRHAFSGQHDYWLICWEDRVVNLSASWPLTQEQIITAASKLNP